MDPDLMTEEELAERDRVMITCTGCGQTYGYAVGDLKQIVRSIERVDTSDELTIHLAIQPELPEA